MSRSALFCLARLAGAPAALAAQAPTNLSELVNRRGVYLEAQTLEAFSGPVIARFPDGVVSERGTLRNGRWQGVHETFYLDGQLEVRETYDNGVLDGPFESYFRTGRLSDKGTYEEGRLEGPYEAYWSRLQGDLHAAHSNAAGSAAGHEGHEGMDMGPETGDMMEQGMWHDGMPCGEWYRFLPRNAQGLRTGESVQYPPCPARSR
jgi:antitoxin component YwqK of YwqJK toxin-antitoxin module